MNANPDERQRDEERPQARDDDLARARDVLARTMSFLQRCAEDPQAALAADDPRELIRGLESLAIVPPAPAEDQPRTLQIRRRRSA